MATPPRPAATFPQRVGGPLADVLVALAGTPDDASHVESLLVTIAKLTADLVQPVSFASVTATRDGAPTTVATSSELALAVDLAQYADETGPCLEALDSGMLVDVPDISATMNWPRFRDAAFGLGLRASVSIPLFAGRGDPVAALNLYAHDPDAMAPLTEQIWAAYDPHRAPAAVDHPAAVDRPAGHDGEVRRDGPAQPGPDDLSVLDGGAAELVTGLIGAFAVRAVIQQAIGVVMSTEHGSADDAYLVLRVRVAETGASLTDVATAVLQRHG